MDGCTVGRLKRLATTALLTSLLAVCAAAPAAASHHSRTPPKHCGKRGHGHQGHNGHGPPAPFRPATVYEVAGGTARPGSKVHLHGVLSAVATSGGRAWLAVAPSDPGYSGWEYSGLEIHLPSHPGLPKIDVGDRVSVDGTVTADGAGNWLGISGLKIDASGEPVEPLDVADTDLLAPSDPGALDSVLVRVPNLSIATASSTETTMTDGLALGNAIIGELPVPFSLPFEFQAVTGIADTLGTGPRLLPRSFDDFDLGP